MRRWAPLLVALLVTVYAACGTDEQPDVPDVPPGAIAVVGDAVIGKRSFEREMAALRRAQASGTSAKHLRKQAVTGLLRREWIRQEGQKRDIVVTEAAARARWRAVARRQFPSRQTLRRFLGEQREADVVAQLRLQMLTDRIEDQVRRDADARPDKAIEGFRERFARDWSAVTRCRATYRAPGCGRD